LLKSKIDDMLMSFRSQIPWSSRTGR